MDTKGAVWREAERATTVETEKKLRDEFAIKLINRGLDTDDILELTDLELKDVERLRESRRPLAG